MHPYWMYQCDTARYIKPFIKGRPAVSRRQDLPSVYSLNGAIYLAKREWLLERQAFVGAETVGYIMSKERSVDLDTPEDWRWAEFLIEQKDD